MAKQSTEIMPLVSLPHVSAPYQPTNRPVQSRSEWTKDNCPNCGYANADVDVEGVLWCPACGYSRQGCYT